MKTFGEQVLEEIRRRGLLGEFFDYAGYQRLRKVADIIAMRALLTEQGHAPDEARTVPTEIVDHLAANLAAQRERVGDSFQIIMSLAQDLIDTD